MHPIRDDDEEGRRDLARKRAGWLRTRLLLGIIVILVGALVVRALLGWGQG
ncbi:MAG: hypothetical protein JWQ36_3494 [Enterovirga sp.]|jgi:hypothetical protein|nr:hypothetical protein [Enterovirga sp.]